MSKLTDQLKAPRLRRAVKGDVPEWWPAAQIAGAAIVGVGFVVASITHFGKSDTVQPTATSQYTGITAAPITAAPITTPGQETTVPPAATTPDGSTPAAPGSMPTAVDAATVAVATDDAGTTKAIPIAAWLSARDNVLLIYPNSTVKAVKLTQSAGTSHTFAITISNSEDTFDVPVTAGLQTNGVWAAS